MKRSRSDEAREVLARNPKQKLFESGIPCKKCSGFTARIALVKGIFSGVKCVNCSNAHSKLTHKKIRSTSEGREKTRAQGRAKSATPEGRAKRSAQSKQYRLIPGFIEKRRAQGLAWAKENPERHRAKFAKYRAAKLKRTPKWADLGAIQQFYKNCPEGHHVDHIIPLQGKLVSGLHVLENLQYLPAAENCGKCNKFDPWTFAT